MNNNKGYTFVELIAVLVIISILSLIGVSTYNKLIRTSMMAEGKVLVSSVAKAEWIYYAEHSRFYSTGGFVFTNDTLGIDARQGKYFQEYDVRTFPNDIFMVVAHGFGDAFGTSIFYDTDPNNSGLRDLPAKILVLGI